MAFNMKRFILLLWIGLISGCAQRPSGFSGRNTATEVITARRAEVLFLGHNSKHHDSWKYAPWLSIKLFKSGVNLSYTTDLNDLNPENLKKFDALVIYANHDELLPAQELALKEFVEGGKGLVPIHSAAGCFGNSEWYVKTIGGQFASHKMGTFKNVVLKADHPVMKGVTAFETWDETYVHKNINPDILVLGERIEGDHHEPYTWVRTQGKGRVFYTAYGHEDKTWTNQGFLDLVRNGILWAVGDQVKNGIEKLKIPDVDIYDSDTISKYTARHVVPKMQDALSPAESNKLTQVLPDFEIKLFAAEPDITNPIAMAWDERGRLWVVESVDYPNTFKETDGAANDRIKICEDTDGDGRADKFTVFADNLNIPTSLVFANGGVIVSMAPYFVFLKDTNGDDKADVSENLMVGWGKNDTHAGPSNLQYGFDNKIWGVTGYSGFNGTIEKRRASFPMGVYRFKPNGSAFEYLANTSNNTWGLGMSEDNNVFISTANNTHSAFYSMPSRFMTRQLPGDQSIVQGVQKIDGHYDAHALTPNLRQVDVVGGFTAAAGHHLYTARNFPKEYWNRIAFVSDPTLRLVHNAIMERDGAGFKEKDGWNLLASSDEWFGPVQAEVGPDGAVWIADWYNFIIQHNVFVPRQAPVEFVLPFVEQPHGQGNAFSSSLRDLSHGRIYRVVYKNAKPAPALNLNAKDLSGLLTALENDNMFWRMTAQRLIVESKNLAALPGLFKIIRNKNIDELGLNGPAVHALWTLHGLGALNGSDTEAYKVAVEALNHPAPGVRKAALQVLPANELTFGELLQSGVTEDSDLNTRLALLVAIADYPASEIIGEWIFKASQNSQNSSDKWISKALFAAALGHEKGFLKASKAISTPSEYSKLIVTALDNETYPLGRRSNLHYAPEVTGKEIVFKATVSGSNDRTLEGFIMGLGGGKENYGLYIQEGTLYFSVKQHGTVTSAQTTAPLPEKFDLVARLARGGLMSLEIDGKIVAKAQAHGLFTAALDGIRTGEDWGERENNLGSYDGKFGLVGNFQNATLSLRRPADTPPTDNVRSEESTAVSPSSGKTVVLELKVVPDMMQYDKKLITVKAGQRIVLTIENPDGMQHNLLLIRPGSLQKVGKAADEMLRDPQAAEKSYVPAMPEILYATKLINQGESVTLEFVAPEKPGDYPYVCTFPGHWRGMNGILRVGK